MGDCVCAVRQLIASPAGSNVRTRVPFLCACFSRAQCAHSGVKRLRNCLLSCLCCCVNLSASSMCVLQCKTQANANTRNRLACVSSCAFAPLVFTCCSSSSNYHCLRTYILHFLMSLFFTRIKTCFNFKFVTFVRFCLSNRLAFLNKPLLEKSRLSD